MLGSITRIILVVTSCVVLWMGADSYLRLIKMEEENKLMRGTLSTHAALLFHMGTYTVANFHNSTHCNHDISQCDECHQILSNRLKLLELSEKEQY